MSMATKKIAQKMEQGAALARAMLEVLADAPGLVLVTTHFDNLKALAETDARFRNAGMEYDPETRFAQG